MKTAIDPGAQHELKLRVARQSVTSTKTSSGLRLAFAGGGTGGHIVPGLHLLDQLEAQAELPADLLWFHTGRPVEEPVMRGLEERFAAGVLQKCVLRLEPAGGGAPTFARLARHILPSIALARRQLRARGTHVLLGLGGFTTLPAVLAARSLGIPCALLEINAAKGKATRVLAPLCQAVYHAWPATLAPGSSPKHVLSGPPLGPRYARRGSRAQDLRSARERMDLDAARPMLLILGGSQGAGSLNEYVRSKAAEWIAAGLQIVHQVGPGRLAEGATELSGAGKRHYQALEYLGNVPAALAAADLCLCRGGASTLAEMAAVGTPAWVVPFPHHRDRHQERNARQLGAAVRIVQEEELAGAPGAARAAEIVGLLVGELRAQLEELAAYAAAAPSGDGAQAIIAGLQGLSMRSTRDSVDAENAGG